MSAEDGVTVIRSIPALRPLTSKKRRRPERDAARAARQPMGTEGCGHMGGVFGFKRDTGAVADRPSR